MDRSEWREFYAKRKLAECLRDLAGWHPFMVYTGSWCITGPCGDGPQPVIPRDAEAWNRHPDAFAHLLPDPDAPANWGVWLGWLWRNTSGHIRLDADRDWWSARWTPEHRRRHVETLRFLCPARALLTLVCMTRSSDSLPPSVQAWWAEQQEARHG